MTKKFWNLKKIENSAELIIYGEISDMEFWGDEVTPKQMSQELTAMGDVSEIIVRINSPGGDVFAGVAIHSMLKRHQASKTVYIDGIAASIASIIAMVGDKIIMPKGSMMMIHSPMSSIRMARADRLRKQADLLDTIRDQMVGIYSEKSGISTEELNVLLEAETWYTADEAVASGLAHEIEANSKIAASLNGETAVINGIEMNWKQFANAPMLAEMPAALKPVHTAVELDTKTQRAKHATRSRELQLKLLEV